MHLFCLGMVHLQKTFPLRLQWHCPSYRDPGLLLSLGSWSFMGCCLVWKHWVFLGPHPISPCYLFGCFFPLPPFFFVSFFRSFIYPSVSCLNFQLSPSMVDHELPMLSSTFWESILLGIFFFFYWIVYFGAMHLIFKNIFLLSDFFYDSMYFGFLTYLLKSPKCAKQTSLFLKLFPEIC